MRKLALLWAGLLILGGCAMQNPQGDLYKTSAGDVYVLPLGHGSVQITWNGKIIQVDPYSSVADYAALPKADLVLITHDHYDHLDAKAWKETQKEGTAFIASPTAAKDLPQGTSALSNGDSLTWQDVQIDAVPAYNLVHKQPNGKFWHPKGWGNGYVLHFGDFRLYLGGDTENIPEMADIAGVDVAFLPKNLPYTMTDEMFVDAAKRLKPKVLYPYHYETVDKIKLQSAVGKDILLK